MNLRRSKVNYKNNRRMDDYCLDLLKGKIEFLLSEYGDGETCKISNSVLERVLKKLKKNGNENAIVECKIVKGGKEKRYVLLGIDNQIIKFDLKLGIAEITNCTKNISEAEKPTEYISLEDLVLDERYNDYLYTLDNFILDTNINIRTKNILPNLRPVIVCGDGFAFSVQASNVSACRPRGNNRTDYTHFEVDELIHEIPELQPYKKVLRLTEGIYRNIYEYVPKEIVEEIIEKHGGIDVEKTFEKSELDKLFYENVGLNSGLDYLEDILGKKDRYDKLNKRSEEIKMDDREELVI